MSSLTLHWAMPSQPGRAVKTLVDIGKIPCALVEVDIFSRQQRTKEYLEMYPVGKIPVLKDGDFTLGQSGAIMVYLCELYPHIAHFYGKTIEERAVVNQYLSWYQSSFRPAMFKPVKMLLGAVLFKQKIQQFHLKALVAQMAQAIDKFNQLLVINKTTFITGTKVKIVDFLFYYEITNLPLFDMDVEKWPEVKQWFIQMEKIPEIKAISSEHYQFSKEFKKMLGTIQIVKPKAKL